MTEITKVEANFKAFSKSNVNGKVIDYGNGVSIDTDDVIYTENGPNYHNYTFYIKRENAPADAPLENLVLTPMTNGLYKELLITYNLTTQEKQIVMNGGFVNTKGKIEIKELALNTYNPLAKGMTSCGWQEEENFAIACSSGDHHMGNVESWGSCTANRKPGWYTTTVYRCNFIYDDNDTGGGWWVGEGGGTDNGGGGSQQPGEGTTEPCNGNTTSPTDPNTNIGEGGCSGIPAPINLPNPSDTPCGKIKLQRADTDFNNRITDLHGKTGLKKETGYSQRTNGKYTYHDNGSATPNANSLTPPDLNDPSNNDVNGIMHTHVKDFTYGNPNGPGTIDKKGIKIFSPADVAYFMQMVKNAHDAGRPLSDVYMVMVSNQGNYQIRFTGNQYQIKTFNWEQTKAHRQPFEKYMEENGMTKSKDLEFNMLKYMDGKMNLKGLTLYRMNADGSNTEVKLNPTKTDREENKCPTKI